MVDIIYFPQGLALGENFCNREDEKKRLEANIQTARSTLIMSPRRYGKTSLVLQVLNKLAIAYSHIDLFSELSEIDVQNRVLSAVGDILYSLESTSKKAFAFITDFFSDWRYRNILAFCCHLFKNVTGLLMSSILNPYFCY